MSLAILFWLSGGLVQGTSSADLLLQAGGDTDLQGQKVREKAPCIHPKGEGLTMQGKAAWGVSTSWPTSSAPRGGARLHREQCVLNPGPQPREKLSQMSQEGMLHAFPEEFISYTIRATEQDS